MGSIRVLPDQLINQIAAGEVIERPASVVKELVENAIDAGADQVTVEIVKGGTEKIVVTDNGKGMDEMDARLAFERHATSKLRDREGLFRIGTLGFRGEALASIASVSEVSLQTKTGDALGGVKVVMKGGKDMDVSATGCPVGTKFEISNLFFNVPARKKFLKTEQTEYRHVLETVQDLALAHPEVSFRFVSNGRTAFDLLKTENMQARIGGLFGKAISEEMLEIFYGGQALNVSGFVGKPHTARATRKYQYFLVNGRPVTDHRLGYAVKEAFSSLIPGSQYPVFVISIKIDPKMVDVNVHPRKLEVRFVNPREVFRVVKSTVAAALSKEQSMMTKNIPIRDKNLDVPAFLRKEKITPTESQKVEVEEAASEYDETIAPPAPAPAASFGFGGFTGSQSSPGRISQGGSGSVFGAASSPSSASSDALQARKAYLIKKRAERLIAQGKTEEAARLTASLGEAAGLGASAPAAATPAPQPTSMFAPTAEPATPSVPGHKLESAAAPSIFGATQSYIATREPQGLMPLAQVKNSYIVAEDAEGIVIVDQHAAHERVMLEKFRAAEADREPAQQRLLAPVQLDLNFREKAILDENLDLMRSLGFDLNEFGGNTYTVDAIPDFLIKDDIGAVIRGFIDDLLSDQSPREAHRRHEHILHTLACKAATKFGRRLTSTEQKSLLDQLSKTDGASSCAHGRPTTIRLSFNELEQKFGRKG